MTKDTSIDLKPFYPMNLLNINSVTHTDESIKIKMKSKTHSYICRKCGEMTTHYHGTYTRIVQDLPILGKTVSLEITSYEYYCKNPKCDATSIVEDFDGFLSYYSRMTERCEDFICTLALETSCEGASRICKSMGIKTNGDSIIRLLIKKYEQQPVPKCSAVIGVDDFAYKRRHSYCTIIVDEENHKPVAVLDGRDGKTLRGWLKNNKHVKAVTRDRASAYAKVIAEELPAAMQIADRFHLHQNLLEAVRKSIGREIPATIAIPALDNGMKSEDSQITDLSTVSESTSKKNTFHC